MKNKEQHSRRIEKHYADRNLSNLRNTLSDELAKCENFNDREILVRGHLASVQEAKSNIKASFDSFGENDAELDVLTDFENELNDRLKNFKRLGELEGNNEIVGSKEQKDKLSHKQQILTLFQIGFFDLPQIKNLSIKKKGQLISHFINRDEKNSSDYIRYFAGKNIQAKYNCKTSENIKTVNQLLKSLGLKEIPQDIKDLP